MMMMMMMMMGPPNLANRTSLGPALSELAERAHDGQGAPVTLVLMIKDEQEEAGGGAKNVAEECNNNPL